MRAFLKKYLLEAILLAAITGAAAGWLNGLISSILPGTEAPRCWIEEQWRDSLGRPPQADPSRFAVLLARLDRDPDGSGTDHLIGAFEGQRGFRPLTTCRVIAIEGSDLIVGEERAEEEADRLRKARGADLILWGKVEDKGALKIWMTGPTVRADLKARPWVVDKGALEPAFGARFSDALQSVTLAALAPAKDQGGGHAVADLLRPVLLRLQNLVADPPAGLTDDAKRSLLLSMAWGFEVYGEQAGDNAALEQAAGAYREALEGFPREQAPADWAGIQMDLGIALAQLGQREPGAERLEQALDAYHLALQEDTRERAPLDWALIQMNLGITLAALGERESGTDRLRQAIAAFQLALEELTSEGEPLVWAETQTNLGVALATLGERENGTEHLQHALEAYLLALQQLTRERAPLDWAKAQMNLGAALSALGAREAGTDRLKRAIEAFHLALEELTPESMPLEWAGTQMNLANTLTMLAQRESGMGYLQQAVEAYRLALQEFTRDRVPLEWAGAQANLGNALAALGASETGTGHFLQAVDAYHLALQERTRQRVPLEWAETQYDLGLALSELEKRTRNMDMAREALLCFQNAEPVLREAGMTDPAQSAREEIDRLQREIVSGSE